MADGTCCLDLAPGLRGRGNGTLPIQAVEREARARGACRSAFGAFYLLLGDHPYLAVALLPAVIFAGALIDLTVERRTKSPSSG